MIPQYANEIVFCENTNIFSFVLVFKSVQQRSQSSFLRSRFFKNGKMAKLTLTDIGKNINMDLEISEENTGLVIIS